MTGRNAPTPIAVARTYFKAVKARDLDRLRGIFADDMELVTQTVGRMTGGDSIAQFYTALLARFCKITPRLGPFRTFADTVVVEVDGQHGPDMFKMASFFTVMRGRIARLAIYQGPAYKKGGKLTDFTKTKPR